MELELYTDAAYNTSISDRACAISCAIYDSTNLLYQVAKVYPRPQSTEYEVLATLYGLDCIFNLYPHKVTKLTIYTDHQGNAVIYEKLLKVLASNWVDTGFTRKLTSQMKLVLNKLKRLILSNPGLTITIQWIPREQNTLCDSLAVDKLQEYNYQTIYQANATQMVLDDLKTLEGKYLKHFPEDQLRPYLKSLRKCYQEIAKLKM